ncbi:MAG: hypothetical protein GC206_04315 [Alphaproteobacteria bacterium]|nr:hypothetical protein [Alphaproteobacteria bacterium]
MAARRRPNFVAALVDLGFAIGAGLCGAFGWGVHAAIGVIAAHLVYWGVSKQNALKATPREQLPALVAISVALIAAVDGLAYFIASLVSPI